MEKQAACAEVGMPWLTADIGGVEFERGIKTKVPSMLSAQGQRQLMAKIAAYKTKISNVLKIVLGNLQVLTGLTSVFTVPWPASFVAFLDALSAFKMDMVGTFAVVDACQLQSSYFKGFAIQFLIPFGIFACCLVAYFVARTCLLTQQKLKKMARSKMRAGIVAAAREVGAVQLDGDEADWPEVPLLRRVSPAQRAAGADAAKSSVQNPLGSRAQLYTAKDFHQAWPATYDALSSSFRTKRARAQSTRQAGTVPMHMMIASTAKSSWLFSPPVEEFTREHTKGCGCLKDGTCVIILQDACKAVHGIVRSQLQQVGSLMYSKDSMKQRVLKVANLAFFFLYPSLCARIFTVFKCEDIDGKLYFSLDFTKQCFVSLDWNVFAAVAAFGMFFYVLGIPALTAYFLYSAVKRDHMVAAEGSGEEVTSFMDVDKYVKHRDTLSTYGDIYTQYNHREWYFELCIMLYKMMLTGALILVRQGSPMQVLAGVVITFAWSLLVAYKKPYADAGENVLALVSASQLFLTMLIGLALASGVEDDLQLYLGVLVIAINVGTIVFSACFLFSRFPYIEKVFTKKFCVKSVSCRFDICVHEDGCLHSWYIRLRSTSRRKADEAETVRKLPRRRDYTGTILKDEFFVNSLMGADKLDMEALMEHIAETATVEDAVTDLVAKEMNHIRQLLPPGATAEEKSIALKKSVESKVRVARLQKHLGYFYACFHPQSLPDVGAQAVQFGRRGIDGERELDDELRDAFGGYDLSAVHQWLRIPLAERIDAFYESHDRRMYRTGAADDLAEHFGEDLDSLLVRLSHHYEVPLVCQLEDVEPITAVLNHELYYYEVQAALDDDVLALISAGAGTADGAAEGVVGGVGRRIMALLGRAEDLPGANVGVDEVAFSNPMHRAVGGVVPDATNDAVHLSNPMRNAPSSGRRNMDTVAELELAEFAAKSNPMHAATLAVGAAGAGVDDAMTTTTVNPMRGSSDGEGWKKHTDATTATTANPMRGTGKWDTAVDDEGNTFYYHTSTHETSWTRPSTV
jgi:hypothetical protein